MLQVAHEVVQDEAIHLDGHPAEAKLRSPQFKTVNFSLFSVTRLNIMKTVRLGNISGTRFHLSVFVHNFWLRFSNKGNSILMAD